MPNSAPTTPLTIPPDYIPSASQSSMQSLAPNIEEAIEAVEDYCREKPWSFALWMIGIGFVLGWKLKPW